MKPQIIINNYIDLTEPREIKSFVCPKTECYSFPLKDTQAFSLEKLTEIVKISIKIMEKIKFLSNSQL